MPRKLKAGDIVVCVNVGPDPSSPGNTLAQRHLVLGDIYEVQADEGLFGGVRVGQRVFCGCCPGEAGCPWDSTQKHFYSSWHASRFERLGSVR